ncbi:carbohydrate ABC transporter permease [Lysobacter korlensis]|uniref:Carbohydrate ABC transporter permease n=1 Tax=Lysobacter korlensis TaxID=553636 RepID=A0ABV6RMG6_9GAMM
MTAEAVQPKVHAVDRRNLIGVVLRRTVLYLFLGFLTLTIILPVSWMIITSLRDNTSALVDPFGFGGTYGIQNYIALFERGDVFNWLRSSVVVNILSVALIGVLSALGGYGFSAYNFRGKSFLFGLLIIGLTIPAQALVVAGYRWVSLLDIDNTYLALVCTYGGWVSFGILIMRNFFDSIPKELREAAIMDGASQWRIFRQIYLPLGQAPMATVLIFSAVWVWNDFIYPLVYLQDQENYTLPIGVLQFTGRTVNEIATQMGVLTFATALPLILYLAFRKQFMRGLMDGAVKG